MATRPDSCEWCGAALPHEGGPGRPAKFCSHAHRQAAYVARRQLSFKDIADRDGWVCHLCGAAVDPNAASDSRMGPSLDHVVPLRRGGVDDLSNVRLAHVACNARKRDVMSAFASEGPIDGPVIAREQLAAALRSLDEQLDSAADQEELTASIEGLREAARAVVSVDDRLT